MIQKTNLAIYLEAVLTPSIIAHLSGLRKQNQVIQLFCNDRISLQLFKQFPGSIFCSEHIDEWTQMLGGKSYHFKNPLFDLDFQINALSACIPGVPVNGFLFFDHTAEFPKGRPDRVIQLEDVPQSVLCDDVDQAEASVMKAWEHLKGSEPFT